MEDDYKKISHFWKKEYSTNVYNYAKFPITEEFEKMATLFAPGESYFYILNMHNLELDYLSPKVEKFLGYFSEDIGMDDLLALAMPEEIERLENKELVIKDFYGRYLKPSEITSYKIVYSYRMKDHAGRERTILHQASALSVTENGMPHHVLSIHSDISHLTSSGNNRISFINMASGKSFYNIDAARKNFSAELSSSQPNILAAVTSREKEVIDLLAKGLSAKQIADELNLSIHTVHTHRKNILAKCGCKNTAELIAETMVAGLVN